ncbi:MAG: DUF1573 domain-containing protein [Thermoguttaceae bacterium]|nr:DUF1573 domain-containing protein [Thermoguttaceae bacterium]
MSEQYSHQDHPSPPARRFSPWDWGFVKLAAALVLLTAASMKTHQLITFPVLGEGILQTRWFQIVLVEFEFTFSLWLLVGIFPRLARWATVLLFGAFFLVSFFKAIAGEESCGCFGAAKVSPWFTTTLDLVLATFAAIAERRPPARRVSLKKRALLLIALWPTMSAALIYFAFLPFLGLDCAEAAFDFGACRQRDELTHTFELTNRSNRPVVITGIKTSCGCMIPDNEADLLGRAIESGQTVALTIRLKTGLSRGKITKATLVRYRGSAAAHRAGRVQLQLSATVQEDYTLDPPVIDLGRRAVPGGEPITSTVTLRKSIPGPMKILALKPSKNYITAEVLSQSDEAIVLEVRVDLGAQTLSGQQDATIVIETDSRSAPSSVLPIRWTAVSRAELSRDSIIIPSDAEGTVSETVTVKTQTPSVIEEITCDDRRIEIFQEEDRSQWEHRVRVEIPETEESLTGTVRIGVRVKDEVSGGEDLFAAELPVYRFARERREISHAAHGNGEEKAHETKSR